MDYKLRNNILQISIVEKGQSITNSNTGVVWTGI